MILRAKFTISNLRNKLTIQEIRYTRVCVDVYVRICECCKVSIKKWRERGEGAVEGEIRTNWARK